MARDPIPTHCFALVVVRRRNRVLLVHERKHEQTWYLPAGRVEPGETFAEAAVRETLEESGLCVELDGVLKIQHTPGTAGARMRVFFLAHAKDDTPPKSEPDEHSLEARWFTLEEARAVPLRGDEVEEWMRYALEDPEVAPLSIIAREVP